MKIALILKGNIRHRQEFQADLPQLEASFPWAEITVLESTYPGHSRALASHICGNCDYLVSVGGDGTLNEILNGCLEATAASPGLALPCLGVLPHGTANDMARALGLDGSMKELCSLLGEKHSLHIDLGKIRCEDEQGTTTDRFFINMADIGIGADVTQRLGRNHRILGSNLRYLKATLTTFLTYRKRELYIESDRGLQWQGRTLALVAANGRFFGSGLCIAPGACLDDGELYITLIGDASIVDFLRNLGRLKKGTPLDHPAASYHHATRLEITATDKAVPVEADGEFIGYTPAGIEIVPAAIKILAPASPGR